MIFYLDVGFLVTVVSGKIEKCCQMKIQNALKLGMVGFAYNPSYLGGRSRRIMSLRPARTKLMSPYLTNKRAGGHSSSSRKLVRP
jgi:hypothetical protein